MDFSLTREDQDVAAVAAARLAEPRPPSWAQATAMGWFDVEAGLVTRAVLAAEFGAALLPLPWWNALSLPAGLARRLAEVTDADAGPCPVALLPDGFRGTGTGSTRLTGSALAVDEAAAAEILIVGCAAGTFRVEVDGPGVERGPADPADPLRGPSAVLLREARAERIGEPQPRPLDEVVLRRDVLTAAEAIGVARRCYRTAVEHVSTRSQFGRPVGSYQGVAFAVADSFARLELGWSQVLRAAWAVETGAPGARTAVHCAVLSGRRAAVLGAEQAIQSLGGLGMTWEHPVHRWYRRALWADRQGGSTRARLEAVAMDLLPARAADPVVLTPG